MDHALVTGIEEAFGWTGAAPLGRTFALGTLPDPDLCARLATPDTLLELAARRSLAHPQVQVLREGAGLHPVDYLTHRHTSRGHKASTASMPKLGRILAEGATVVLDNLAPLEPTLEVACRALSWWAGDLARVNTYLSTGESGGWGLHYDVHDVICVQLSGTKSWEVRGPSRVAPMEVDAEPNTVPSTDVVWEGTLRAGQVMTIPRGWWHMATRDGQGAGHSLHATFGITRRTGRDWLVWISDKALADVAFRIDLAEYAGPDQDQGDHHRLAEAAAALLTRHSPADFLAARRRESSTGNHSTAAGIFGPLTSVVCVADFPPDLDVGHEEVTVLSAGKSITVPAYALPVLTPLLSGHPVDLAELYGHTGVDSTDLAIALVEAGVCAETTPALAAAYDGMISTDRPKRQPDTAAVPPQR